MTAAADLFRGNYSQASPQAVQMYTQHPVTRQILAEMKTQYDTRQRNATAARSLEAFFRQHDNGNGEVRLEDFKAGWALGGVKINPSQSACLRGAYGTPDNTIRWPELIAALDSLQHEQATSIVMTNKCGVTTARHLGYNAGNPVMRGYLNHASRAPSQGGSAKDTAYKTTTVSPKSLMRTSNITPVTIPATGTVKGTFNRTICTIAALTQRQKSMVSPSLSATLDKITCASAASAEMANTLLELDTEGTGCVTVDAFLTACARAGLTLAPDELNLLRQAGHLRRPYDAAPELIDYSALEIVGA